MNAYKSAIKNFYDLIAWQESHKLVLSIYKMTDILPREELYGLSSQMRRCAISITSNIAEGFGRWSYKEKVRFYFISLGSSNELFSQLIVAKDLKYITLNCFQSNQKLLETSQKLISKLIQSSKSKM